MKYILFNKFYKIFNLISISLIFTSIVLLTFKGLNYGVDFKGGTLIEIQTSQENSNISIIRQSFNKMDLGDVTVKNFGSKNDFIIKFEKRNSNDVNFIKEIKKNLSKSIGEDFEFRRVENLFKSSCCLLFS